MIRTAPSAPEVAGAGSPSRPFPGKGVGADPGLRSGQALRRHDAIRPASHALSWKSLHRQIAAIDGERGAEFDEIHDEFYQIFTQCINQEQSVLLNLKQKKLILTGQNSLIK